MQGKWQDTHGLLALADHQFSFLGRHMGLYTNDYTPVDGWVQSDIGPDLRTGAQQNTGFWDSGTLIAPSIVRFEATGGYLTFGGSPWEGHRYYGWFLSKSADPSEVMYAERFEFAPILITAGNVLVFKPILYLANPGAFPPETDVVRTGTIVPFATAAPQSGYLLCDGSVYNIADYPALGAYLGATYGGNGTTTFGVPDPRSRAIGCSGAGSGLTSRAVGEQAGAETHLLSLAEVPAHTHGPATAGGSFLTSGPTPNLTYVVSTGGNNVKLQAATDSQGGGGAHNIVQPTQFFPCFIKT